MKKSFTLALMAVIALLPLLVVGCGDGALKRMTTMSGVYAVEVKGYDVVCFLDSDSYYGGLFCMKKSEVKVKQ